MLAYLLYKLNLCCFSVGSQSITIQKLILRLIERDHRPLGVRPNPPTVHMWERVRHMLSCFHVSSHYFHTHSSTHTAKKIQIRIDRFDAGALNLNWLKPSGWIPQNSQILLIHIFLFFKFFVNKPKKKKRENIISCSFLCPTIVCINKPFNNHP